MSSFRKFIRTFQLPESYQNIKGMNTSDESENLLKITLESEILRFCETIKLLDMKHYFFLRDLNTKEINYHYNHKDDRNIYRCGNLSGTIQ